MKKKKAVIISVLAVAFVAISCVWHYYWKLSRPEFYAGFWDSPGTYLVEIQQTNDGHFEITLRGDNKGAEKHFLKSSYSGEITRNERGRHLVFSKTYYGGNAVMWEATPVEKDKILFAECRKTQSGSFQVENQFVLSRQSEADVEAIYEQSREQVRLARAERQRRIDQRKMGDAHADAVSRDEANRKEWEENHPNRVRVRKGVETIKGWFD